MKRGWLGLLPPQAKEAVIDIKGGVKAEGFGILTEEPAFTSVQNSVFVFGEVAS